jgi:putative membrane protein
MSDRLIIRIFILFFAVGVLLHLVPALTIIPLHITDAFLLAANAVVLVLLLKINATGRFLIFFISSYLLTFAAEAAGVSTGEVFGAYRYGDTMKLQWLEVPLIIPFNWVILVLGMTSVFTALRIPRVILPLLAAGGLVLFDFIMEPVAVQLDYWTWEGGNIPLQNYLAWFIIAWIVSSAAVFLKIKLDSKPLRAYVFIQLGFFLILNVFFRYTGG